MGLQMLRLGGHACKGFVFGTAVCSIFEPGKIMEKQGKRPESQCMAEKPPEPDPNSSDLDNSPDSAEIIDWANPPAELLPRDKFKANQRSFKQQTVMLVSLTWQYSLSRSPQGLRPHRMATPKDRSEKTVRRGRETRAGMEGKVQQEKRCLAEAMGVLAQIDDITSNSQSLDYLAARAGYMKLTLGNKTWNNTFVAHVAACTMKGAREYRDNFNTYDMDPDSQKQLARANPVCRGHSSLGSRPPSAQRRTASRAKDGAMAQLDYRFTFIDVVECPLRRLRPRYDSLPPRLGTSSGIEADALWEQEQDAAYVKSLELQVRASPRLRAAPPRPSRGGWGHPEVCRRPCVLMQMGHCPKGEDCEYCHHPHETRPPKLDRHLRCQFLDLPRSEQLCILVRHLRQRAVDRQFLPEADAVLQAFEDEAKRQGCAVETGKARHRKLDRHLAKLKFGALASLATYQDTSSSFYWAVQRGAFLLEYLDLNPCPCSGFGSRSIRRCRRQEGQGLAGLEKRITELEASRRSLTPPRSFRGGDQSPRSPRSSVGSRDDSSSDLDIIVGGWVDAKRADAQQEVTNMFAAIQMTNAVKELWAPYSRTNFIKVQLVFPDEQAHISVRRLFQLRVIEKLKVMKFTSGVQGSTGNRIWATKSKSPEERARVRALVLTKEFLKALPGRNGTSPIPESDIEIVWNGRLFVHQHQFLGCMDRDGEPSSEDLILSDSRGNHMPWFVKATVFEAATGYFDVLTFAIDTPEILDKIRQRRLLSGREARDLGKEIVRLRAVAKNLWLTEVLDRSANGDFKAISYFRRRQAVLSSHQNYLVSAGGKDQAISDLKKHFRLKWCEPSVSNVSALDILHSLPRSLPTPQLITEEEVCEVLATCKSGKSCGDDGISYEFLQFFMQTECRVHFVEWFNSILFQTSPIPPSWLSSKLTLLPKVPQPSCPSDLRPIVLSSTPGKLFTKILLYRLRNIFPTPVANQLCGIPGSQTLDGSCCLQHLTHLSQEFGLPFIAVKLDITSAFDTLSHTAVARYLQHCGPSLESHVLLSIIVATRVVVSISDATWTQPLERGVLQGSSYSAELFARTLDFYLGALVDKWSRDENTWIQGEDANRNFRKIFTLLYADDLIFLATSHAQATRMLQDVIATFGAIGLQLSLKSANLFARLPYPAALCTPSAPPYLVFRLSNSSGYLLVLT
ncbi:unnamed protein product [Symbiodinium sp. KB8]|nr:unnamed protein product [Symbiodinium sp. KB8]